MVYALYPAAAQLASIAFPKPWDVQKPVGATLHIGHAEPKDKMHLYLAVPFLVLITIRSIGNTIYTTFLSHPPFVRKARLDLFNSNLWLWSRFKFCGDPA